MNDRNRLSSDELHTELEILNRGPDSEWQFVQDKLHRQFIFRDFLAAMQFMQTVALEAEKLDHHPEWCNVYNRVTVDLTTHSAGGITELDFLLAKKMQEHYTSTTKY